MKIIKNWITSFQIFNPSNACIQAVFSYQYGFVAGFTCFTNFKDEFLSDDIQIPVEILKKAVFPTVLYPWLIVPANIWVH